MNREHQSCNTIPISSFLFPSLPHGRPSSRICPFPQNAQMRGLGRPKGVKMSGSFVSCLRSWEFSDTSTIFESREPWKVTEPHSHFRLVMMHKSWCSQPWKMNTIPILSRSWCKSTIAGHGTPSCHFLIWHIGPLYLNLNGSPETSLWTFPLSCGWVGISGKPY